ncbi:hypothetical protein HYV85_00490 [Candidatus Woesearchaeota archaeon]|nr:hypothetical protein [Candidatus Woesearchaeota archaeon]
MTNSQPLCSFTHSEEHMGSVAESTKGPFSEIFDKRQFNGGLERIVLEFTIRRWDPEPGMAFVGSAEPLPQSFNYMPIIYKAFGTKKILWRLTTGVVASVSKNMYRRDFDRQLRPEEFVDFVVAEAESLAGRYGLKVEIVYHGDPFFARKYLPQVQQNPKPGLS